MKPHPRIRKTVKWGGAAATVLLVIVWIGSGWWLVAWGDGSGNAAQLSRGAVVLSLRVGPSGGVVGLRGWAAEWRMGGYKLQLWFAHSSWLLNWDNSVRLRFPGIYLHEFELPLWPVVGAAALLTIGAWRLDHLARRRVRLNLCPRCNYSRTGLAAGAVCPECGSAGS